MIIFKKYFSIFTGVCFLVIVFGCNEISSGEKRRKFEYLYKLSNTVTMFSEYSRSLTYFKDLNFYEERIKLIYDDVSKYNTIKNWTESENLKTSFMKTIDENLLSVSELKKQNLPPEENIRKQYEVIMIRERVAKLNEEIEEEIVRVGKE